LGRQNLQSDTPGIGYPLSRSRRHQTIPGATETTSCLPAGSLAARFAGSASRLLVSLHVDASERPMPACSPIGACICGRRIRSRWCARIVLRRRVGQRRAGVSRDTAVLRSAVDSAASARIPRPGELIHAALVRIARADPAAFERTPAAAPGRGARAARAVLAANVGAVGPIAVPVVAPPTIVAGCDRHGTDAAQEQGTQ